MDMMIAKWKYNIYNDAIWWWMPTSIECHCNYYYYYYYYCYYYLYLLRAILFIKFCTLEWIWSMRQLHVNNLPTVITQLNPVERAEFEPRSSGWLDTNRLNGHFLASSHRFPDNKSWNTIESGDSSVVTCGTVNKEVVGSNPTHSRN